MKRFVFTFQTLYSVKKLLEKQAQGELALIEARRQERLRARMALTNWYDEQVEAYQGELAKGVNVPKMQNYSLFFEYLQDEIDAVDVAIAEIEKEKRACQDKLVMLMKEIKALDNLRDSQFQRYLAELAKEQELELSDFVNFQIIGA